MSDPKLTQDDIDKIIGLDLQILNKQKKIESKKVTKTIDLMPKKKWVRKMNCSCGNDLTLVRIFTRGIIKYGAWCDSCNVTDSVSDSMVV